MAASCWLCLHCWSVACCVIPTNTFGCRRDFTVWRSIFLLLAFMTLARLRSVEALRYYSPGEWGKLLGIDRAPEVRTLRIKLKHLADQEQAFAWSAELCQDWMMAAPEEAAVLYVDGHVRVYHGKARQYPSTMSPVSVCA